MKEIDCTRSWWPPGDIIFCPEQVVWLLENYELISQCIWPREPNDVRSQTLSPHAYFESPTAVWIEFMPRFQATGRDGEMAIQRYAYKLDNSRISQLVGCKRDEVDNRIARAIEYMATRKRRKRSYWRFCNHAKEKNATFVSEVAFSKNEKKKI